MLGILLRGITIQDPTPLPQRLPHQPGLLPKLPLPFLVVREPPPSRPALDHLTPKRLQRHPGLAVGVEALGHHPDLLD